MEAEIKVMGMHCHACEMLIRDSLEEMGVKAVVSKERGSAVVEFDDMKITIEKIMRAIKKEGYDVL